MGTITKQDILEAIRRTAKENNGKPLGMARFEKETGIKRYEWKKHYARFGEAQIEAFLLILVRRKNLLRA